MLELTQIAGQILEAGEREREQRTLAEQETARAAEVASDFNDDQWTVHKERIKRAKTSWLVAHASDGLPARRVNAPSGPLPPHIVIATDGSQIAPDRHETSGGVFLLNVGRVFLTYGTGARARLDSRAEVLHITETGGNDMDEDEAVAAVAPLRFAREMRELSILIEEAAATGLPSVAFMDGSLIAWFLDDEKRTDAAKKEGFETLKRTLETARSCAVPLVGYVSGPGSRDSVNALRVTLCTDEPVDCGKCAALRAPEERPCLPIRRATDASLYRKLLAPGQRSATLTSFGQTRGFSQILLRYDPLDWIGFFYLNVESEIARIEIPAWVAEDADLVERVHAVCVDQARKGRGYPVALAEAHELAVVRGSDRQAFLTLLQRSMVKAGTPVATTRKALAKRTRAV